MKLEGKTALITGASRGIGLAIARKLAAEGVRLVLPWFDWPQDSEAMRDEFAQQDDRHIFMKADLRLKDDVTALANLISSERGCLDILINNIERGGMPVVHGSYEREINKDQWQLELETTLLGKRLLLEQCFPLMSDVENASIINISSIAGLTGRSGPAGLLFSDGYSAANRGVAALTETWARIGAPNVRVNEIMLGLIDTRHGNLTRGWDALTNEEKKQLINHTLLKRTGIPEEVAKTVLFIVKDATYMTGSTIRIDGGYILGGENVPKMPDGII